MKVSFIKSNDDSNKFRLPSLLGLDVFSLDNNENIDNKIDELIKNNYNTIIISNELASFSQKINSEYLSDKNINIIISKR